MPEQKTGAAVSLFRWAGLSLLFVLTRALLAIPWLLDELSRDHDLDLFLRCAATLLIWLLAVAPEHAFRCGCIARAEGLKARPFMQSLRVTLYRVGRVWYAAVPAAAVAVLLYYILNSNIGALRILKDVGSIFGSQRRYGYDLGLALLLGVLAAFVVLLLFRWYRHTPNDYLGTVRPFRKAPYNGAALGSALMAAAAYILWGLILYLHVNAELSALSGLMSKMTKLPGILQKVFGHREFRVEMGLVLLLVYCPLWCVRKRLAVKAAARLRDDAA